MYKARHLNKNPFLEDVLPNLYGNSSWHDLELPNNADLPYNFDVT
jgi:hypothetical protein